MRVLLKSKVISVIYGWLVHYMREKKKEGIEWVEFPTNQDSIYFRDEFYQKIEPEINFVLKKLIPEKNCKLNYKLHLKASLSHMLESNELRKKRCIDMTIKEIARSKINEKSRIVYFLREENLDINEDYVNLIKECLKSFVFNGFEENPVKIEIDRLISLKNQADVDLVKIITDLLAENNRLKELIKTKK